jgi:glucoamylase
MKREVSRKDAKTQIKDAQSEAFKKLAFFAPLRLCVKFVLFLAFASASLAQSQVANNLAPGAPGHDAQWESAGKEGVGTSASLESKVWFTLQGGVMTEVYYPTVDTANVQKLELIIVHAQTGTVETESRDTISQVIPDKDSLSFTQINTAKSGEYKITKKYVTDPQRNVVLIRIEFEGHFKRREDDYQLYVYYDPSLNNSGMHDTAWTHGDSFLAVDGDKASALIVQQSFSDKQAGGFMRANSDYSEMTNGFLGATDGLTQLRSGAQNYFPRQLIPHKRAENGNVVQVGELARPAIEREYCCQPYTLALGFGKTPGEALAAAQSSLRKGFETCELEYRRGWRNYLKKIRRVGQKYRAQFNMAAMILKAHEDKTYRGANVASLSVPWGGGANANEPNVSGYHTVWSRDLYQVATAFYAMGDKAAADRALNYLFTVQQKADGSFPQNSWLDGRPAGGSLQMDEVAYPLILAYQLGRTDNETWVKHVKPAADFLVRQGPATPQERWEEEAGYSPSTIAAEIAGLVCAAEIARRNHDEASAKTYLSTADEWARRVDRWTVTTTGAYLDKNYYLRISDDDDPNDGAPLEINSNGGTYDEREIVDAGFLELVRLGIKRADDPLITKSLAVVDRVIQVKTPNGAAWYRYNHDAYGERADGGRYDAQAGRGRLWTLLTGERGQYELARGEMSLARERLDAMMNFANEALMIPEQVWDKPEGPATAFRFGEGTGSATPLCWAMAQFIRLAVNLQEGRNLDTPDIVAARYSKRQ